MTNYMILASRLNLREKPARNAKLIGEAPRATIVSGIQDQTLNDAWRKVMLPDGKIGWMSYEYLLDTDAFSAGPWIKMAAHEFGVGEYPDINQPSNNPRITEYHSAIGSGGQTEQIAWCSAFMAWCMKQSGIKTTRVTPGARSWANWGINAGNPVLGSVVVFWRRPGKREDADEHDWPAEKLKTSGDYGHVALVVGKPIDGRIEALGGNQSSARNGLGEVCKSTFPLGGNDYGVLAYRLPKPLT